MQNVPVITIDGVAASGKGTCAQLLSEKLAWHLLDSGSYYRAIACYLHENLPADSYLVESKVTEYLDGCKDLPQVLRTYISGTLLRSEQIGKTSSQISTYPIVRNKLNLIFLDLCKLPGLVADGRDMGSVVFPHAISKFYLTADLHTRAQRRYVQLQSRGNMITEVNKCDIINELQMRDAQDKNRALAPLSEDKCIVIDNTDLSVENTVKIMYKHYQIELDALNNSKNQQASDATPIQMQMLKEHVRKYGIKDE